MDSVGRNGRVWLWSGAHVVRSIGPVGDVVFAERSRVNHVRISIGFGVLVQGRAILKREVTGECRGTLGGWRYGRDVRVGRVGSEGLGNRVFGRKVLCVWTSERHGKGACKISGNVSNSVLTGVETKANTL